MMHNTLAPRLHTYRHIYGLLSVREMEWGSLWLMAFGVWCCVRPRFRNHLLSESRFKVQVGRLLWDVKVSEMRIIAPAAAELDIVSPMHNIPQAQGMARGRRSLV